MTQSDPPTVTHLLHNPITMSIVNVLLLALAVHACLAPTDAAEHYSWRAFAANNQRTGSAPWAGVDPASSPAVEWQLQLPVGPEGLFAGGGSVVASGDMAFTIGRDHTLAVNLTTGVVAWSTLTVGAAGALSLSNDGLMLFVPQTTTNTVSGLSTATGKVVWSVDNANCLYPTVMRSTKAVLLACASNPMHAASHNTLKSVDVSTGAELWSYALPDLHWSYTVPPPTLSTDEATLFVTDLYTLYALDTRTGAIKWTYKDAVPSYSPTQAGPAGPMYAAGASMHHTDLVIATFASGHTFAFDASNGSSEWKFSLGGVPSGATPVYMADSNVVVLSLANPDPTNNGDGCHFSGDDDFGFNPCGLVALNASLGTFAWVHTDFFSFQSVAYSSSSQLLYISGGDGTLVQVLDGATGKQSWNVSSEGVIESSYHYTPIFTEHGLLVSWGNNMTFIRNDAQPSTTPLVVEELRATATGQYVYATWVPPQSLLPIASYKVWVSTGSPRTTKVHTVDATMHSITTGPWRPVVRVTITVAPVSGSVVGDNTTVTGTTLGQAVPNPLWATGRADAAHTARAPQGVAGPAGPHVEVVRNVTMLPNTDTSAAVTGAGVLVLPAAFFQSAMYGLDGASLSPVWSSGITVSSVLLLNDGLMAGGSRNGAFLALQQNGQRLWTVSLGSVGLDSATVVGVLSGQLLLTDQSSRVGAVDMATRKLTWVKTLGSSTLARSDSVLMAPMGLVVSSYVGGVVAMTPSTGTQVFNTTFTAGGCKEGALLAASHSHVVATSCGAVWSVFAYDGAVTWSATSPDTLWGAPALTSEGDVVVAASFQSKVAKVARLSGSTGSFMWSVNMTAPIRMPAILDSAGHVYVGDNTGVWCLDASTGAVVWKLANFFAENAYDGALIGADNTLYLLNERGPYGVTAVRDA